MPYTVGELLSQLKIELQIAADDKLLNTPLDLFHKAFYTNIVTLIWLYNAGLIDPKNTALPPKLGEVSARHAKDFYFNVHEQITTGILDLAEAQKASAPIPAIKINLEFKSKWLNAIHLTSWLRDEPLYQALFHDVFPKQGYMPIKEIPFTNFTILSTTKNLSLVEQYPTLISLISNFPLNAHTLPTSAQTYILDLDMRELEGLTDESYTELACYMTLFMFQRARLMTSTINYTYTSNTIKTAISQVIKEQAQIIQKHLQKNLIKLDEKLDSILNKSLLAKGIDLDPDLLGLVCFEICPLLKRLHVDSWNALGIKITQLKAPPIAFYPASNPFFFGLVLYDKNKIAVSTNNADMLLMHALLKLTSSIGFFDNRIANLFENYRNKISNPDLRKAVNPTTINSYTLNPNLNYGALSRFLLQQGITATQYMKLKYKHLQQFIDIINTKAPAKEIIISQLAHSELFIQLRNTDTLLSQIENSEKLLQTLNKKLQKINPMHDNSLVHEKWLIIQKDIWSQFNKMLNDKQHEIKKKYQADEEKSDLSTVVTRF